jgi:TRAP-type C4-dicarboxylate transport system permease small subunit
MVKKILDAIEKALKVISTVFMAVIVAILFYAVVMRYIFHQPPGWSIELSRYMFLWMVMFSVIVVTRERSHIQITFILDHLPDRARFVWLNILRILMIGFCVIMVHQGVAIYPIVSEASSPALDISMGWLYLSVPVGGVLMGIYILEGIVVSVIDRFNVGPSNR